MQQPVSAIARVMAGVAALSATVSIVWGMATLGYPPNAAAGAPLALACSPQQN